MRAEIGRRLGVLRDALTALYERLLAVAGPQVGLTRADGCTRSRLSEAGRSGPDHRAGAVRTVAGKAMP